MTESSIINWLISLLLILAIGVYGYWLYPIINYNYFQTPSIEKCDVCLSQYSDLGRELGCTHNSTTTECVQVMQNGTCKEACATVR